MKCGACGAVGHMKTNRMCPLFGKKPDNEDLLYGDMKDLKEEMKIDTTSGKIIISKKAFEKVIERKESFHTPKVKIPTSNSGSRSPVNESVSEKEQDLLCLVLWLVGAKTLFFSSRLLVVEICVRERPASAGTMKDRWMLMGKTATLTAKM